MDLRGQSESLRAGSRRRQPRPLSGGAYDCTRWEGAFGVNLGGTAGISSCPI